MLEDIKVNFRNHFVSNILSVTVCKSSWVGPTAQQSPLAAQITNVRDKKKKLYIYI